MGGAAEAAAAGVAAPAGAGGAGVSTGAVNSERAIGTSGRTSAATASSGLGYCWGCPRTSALSRRLISLPASVLRGSLRAGGISDSRQGRRDQ